MVEKRLVRDAENRLAGFNHERAQILAEVSQRIVDRLVDAATVGPTSDTSLEYVLNDVAYAESRRLESAGDDHGLERWRDLSRRLMNMNDVEKRAELTRLVDFYGRDVVGNFDPRVYKMITGVGPAVLGFVFSPIRSVSDGLNALSALDARITADGDLAVIRACAERGTIVVAPTHSSNMDSVVMGLGLLRAGLPPVTYGAGKNLFSNPFISFFMRNLGAYRVDRRLRFALYKDVLKEYSTVLLEHGYHSLFFPGGTRCRSNVIEKNLKLGLLGTTVTAYKNQIRAGNDRRIYVVPATINYRLTLEAETLIDDYLAETGKNRYIITDDEFSRIGRIAEFFRKILVHEGSVVVRFGRPMDVFGNEVTDDGDSIDRAGRPVDPASFLRDASGAITDDDQRDAEYTRGLGKHLAAAYPRLTVLHATHVVARVLFDAAARIAGTRDVYRMLRASPDQLVVPLANVESAVAAWQNHFATDASGGQLHPMIALASASALIDDAVKGLGTYHTRPAVVRRGDTLHIGDLKLLYYYQNRTAHISTPARASQGAS